MTQNLILIHGSYAVGKSTLAMDITTTLSKLGYSTQYVEEWVKSYANRKVPLSPIDQIAVLGGQTFNINTALTAGYDYVVACSSPMLCSFYANYYSKNSFPGLIQASHDWRKYLKEDLNIKIYEFFLYLPDELYLSRYHSVGRYEGITTAIEFQESMYRYFEDHYDQDIFGYGQYTSDEVLKILGVIK